MREGAKLFYQNMTENACSSLPHAKYPNFKKDKHLQLVKSHSGSRLIAIVIVVKHDIV